MNTLDPTLWQGRTDAEEGPGGRRWHQVVQPLGALPGVALLGFACDAGVVRNQGRPGAAEGPAALRRYLANVPLRFATPLYDAGDVVCTGDALEAAQADYAASVARLLAHGHRPLGLGGGHEIAWAAFSGLAQHLQAEARPRIGILNFDAHFDLRAGERGSSGTPFRQIAEDCAARGWDFNYLVLGISEFGNTPALFARAEQLGVRWRLDRELTPWRLDAAKALLDDFLAGIDHLYLTTCLDVLPPGAAPGVSAPAARGLEVGIYEELLRLALDSGKLRLADVAELNPRFDQDGHTARLAARVIATLAEAPLPGAAP